jgi:hypothetical protein
MSCLRRALQGEAKLWRRISRVLLAAPSDPFLKRLYQHTARVAYHTANAALRETVAAHRAIREGLEKDLGQDFLTVIKCLFELRFGEVGEAPDKVRVWTVGRLCCKASQLVCWHVSSVNWQHRGTVRRGLRRTLGKTSGACTSVCLSCDLDQWPVAPMGAVP